MTQTEQDTERAKAAEERAAFYRVFDVAYSAQFVPQSQSRNKGEKNPSLNWTITVTRGRMSITTDYTQGIGHMPGYQQMRRRTLDVAKQEETAAETGKVIPLGTTWKPGKTIPVPSLDDVLYSLVMDASTIDCATYEEFASEYGYDEDSRKGEAIYRAGLEIGLRMRSMFGEEGLTRLRALFEGY